MRQQFERETLAISYNDAVSDLCGKDGNELNDSEYDCSDVNEAMDYVCDSVNEMNDNSEVGAECAGNAETEAESGECVEDVSSVSSEREPEVTCRDVIEYIQSMIDNMKQYSSDKTTVVQRENLDRGVS